MAPSVEFVALADGHIRSRFERILRHLDHWGDVVATDAGRLEDRRLLEFAVLSPGGTLAVEARELFREYYKRNRTGGWDIVGATILVVVIAEIVRCILVVVGYRRGWHG